MSGLRRDFDHPPALVGVDVGQQVFRGGKGGLGSFASVVVAVASKLGEEPPAPAVAGDMVQREVGGDGLEPAAHRGAGRQAVEITVGPQENLLRDVLRLRVVGRDPHRRRENHVLVAAHEDSEIRRTGHTGRGSLHVKIVIHAQNTAGARKSRNSQRGRIPAASESPAGSAARDVLRARRARPVFP